MDKDVVGKRKKRPKACPNPLFMFWLKEWADDAAAKGMKTQYSYKKVNTPNIVHSYIGWCIMNTVSSSQTLDLDEICSPLVQAQVSGPQFSPFKGAKAGYTFKIVIDLQLWKFPKLYIHYYAPTLF